MDNSQSSTLNSPPVPAGYKQTEVGVIPEGWDVTFLGDLLSEKPSYGINAPAVAFDSRFPTYLRITDISEQGRFIHEAKASVNHPASTNYGLNAGDLVFARTGASVGKSYHYRSEDGELVFAGFLIRFSPDNQKLISEYLKFYAQSGFYWNWVRVNSMRSGQPGINSQEYASLPVALPPTTLEQQLIAEALSDADALIKGLEGLIAKKLELKIRCHPGTVTPKGRMGS